MDTNLLDSCREARGEIGEVGAAARNAGDEDDDVDYYQKVSGVVREVMRGVVLGGWKCDESKKK